MIPPAERTPTAPGFPPRSWWKGREHYALLILILALSLTLRLWLVSAATPVYVGDARDYRVLAHNLATEKSYQQEYHGESWAYEGFTFRAYRPPGYPVLLAAWHTMCGWNPDSYLYLNIAADLVTQVCWFFIAARVLGNAPGLILCALLGVHVLWTPNPMSESVYTAIFSLLALLMVAREPLADWRNALSFGMLAAAALFTRPITACLFPVLIARSWPRRRHWQTWLLLILSVAPSLLALGAWSLRNYRLFGEFVPLTTNLGVHNAWDFGFPADRLFAELRSRGLNEAQINQEFLRLERARAVEYPLPFLLTWATRSIELFSLKPPVELQKTLWGEILPPTAAAGRLYAWSYALYLPVYILAAAGAALLVWRRRRLQGVGWLVLSYILLHGLVSRGDLRLIAPLYPAIAFFAAAALTIWSSSRKRALRNPTSPALDSP